MFVKINFISGDANLKKSFPQITQIYLQINADYFCEICALISDNLRGKSNGYNIQSFK